MEIVGVVIGVVLVGINGYILLLIRSFVKGYAPHQEEESVDERELTEEELSIMARQEDFDRRIQRMHKEVELAKGSMINPLTGNIAEELDPSVYNIPHDKVKGYYDLYDEYAK